MKLHFRKSYFIKLYGCFAIFLKYFKTMAYLKKVIFLATGGTYYFLTVEVSVQLQLQLQHAKFAGNIFIAVM